MVSVLLKALLVVGGLLYFADMFGGYFLPSTEWASKSHTFGLVAGLISAILVLLHFRINVDKIQGGEAKKAVIVLCYPVMGYFLGRAAAVIVVPMMLALIAGHENELTFIVEETNGIATKRCRPSLVLQGLPWPFDRVCGLPNDFRQGVAPGRRVIVIGHGTSFGIFADSLRHVD